MLACFHVGKSLIALSFLFEVAWHLICADAKLLLVMGMNDNVIESTVNSTVRVVVGGHRSPSAVVRGGQRSP